VAHWQSIENQTLRRLPIGVKAYLSFATRINRVNRVKGVVNTVDGYDRLVDNSLEGFIERIKGKMTDCGLCAEKPEAVGLYQQRSRKSEGSWFHGAAFADSYRRIRFRSTGYGNVDQSPLFVDRLVTHLFQPQPWRPFCLIANRRIFRMISKRNPIECPARVAHAEVIALAHYRRSDLFNHLVQFAMRSPGKVSPAH